jgi:curli biogenesis system outer membrane secretion channel CsgG
MCQAPFLAISGKEGFTMVLRKRICSGGKGIALAGLLSFFLFPMAFAEVSPDDKASPKYFGPRKRIAVLEFDVKAKDAPRDAGSGLREMLVTALVESGRFIVLEREELESIFREQKLGISGAVTPRTAADIGKMIGAQVLVKGVITEFQESRESVGAGRLSIKAPINTAGLAVVKGYVAMDIRAFDTATGTILFSHKAEGRVIRKGAVGELYDKGMAVGTGEFKKTALGEASRKAIQDAVDFIVKQMKDVPWQGRVVSVQGKDVYINAGQGSGLKVGDVLEIYQRGEELIDPKTGEFIGYQISKIGRVQISRIEEKFSIAQVITGSGGGKGDIVKLLEGEKGGISTQPSEPGKKPKMRIMVVIPEIHITRKIPDPAGETEIIRKLLEKGFDVVDQQMVAAIRYEEIVSKAIKDEKVAVAIGRDYGADVIIIGEAFSEFVGRLPGDMISCRARVEARAIKVDTGSIIGSDGRHGSGLDISENVAAKKALQQAASELADYFIGKLSTIGQEVKPISVSTVQILLTNVDYKRLRQFEKAIEDIEGVKDVHRLSFSEGAARLEVEYSGEAQELADKLAFHDFGTFEIKITSFSANKLEIEISERGGENK